MEEVMVPVKTDPGLLAALAKASTQKQTQDEMHKQRLSFIMSVVGKDSGITKEHVEAVLERQEGRSD